MPGRFKDKIVNLGELKRRIDTARAEGQTVVQCHGCFDIVHPGHIRYLQFARGQGDILVVSITGDSDVHKGENRPYIPQELRAENLAALMFVDYVFVTTDPTASQILSELRPDVYVKGREYENSTDPGFMAEKRIIEAYGGRIIFSSGETVFSSTQLIERIGEGPDFVAQRVNHFCRRHDIHGDRMTETLSKFRDLHVLVIGDVVLDRYVFCDALGVASESPVLSLVERDTHQFIGGAAVVARHVAAMGAHAFLLSSGANDQETEQVKSVLAKESVETHLVPSRPQLVQKTRFLADDDKVLKVDRAQSCPLDSVAERHAAMILEQQSKLADAVIFCDFGYGMITGSLLARVLPMLRHNVKVLTADASGGRANLLHYRHADLLCPTEREARAMLNDHESGLSVLAWQLLERTEARHLFITLEKRGMVVFERRSQDRQSPDWAGRLKSDQLPSFADRVVDRLGCGDALLAAATLALATGDSLARTAYLGNAAAAIEIAMMGNHPVGHYQLQEWLRCRQDLLDESQPASARKGLVVSKSWEDGLCSTNPEEKPSSSASATSRSSNP
ncbi:MAG: PfkB family carbohydrate kinase [Planctomycetota bacterium]|jgi:rfaE bifunctional protein kinase chain/domain/rfaE bifunctional protein nucleotidyltransferase chain/domain